MKSLRFSNIKKTKETRPNVCRMPNLLAIGFSFLLFPLLFIPNATHAENGTTYEVSSALLNVRSEPANDAQIIGQLTTGNQIVVFNEKYGWVQTYYAGQEAWVAKHHLALVDGEIQSSQSNSSPNSEDTSKAITITANSVNIRSGPGTNHSIIGSTSSGDTYNTVDSAGDWYKVSLASGDTGWIAGWLTNTGTKLPASNSSNQDSDNANTSNQESTNQSLNGYNIVLDPGHGGKDPGSIGFGGIFEKDVISSTANAVAQELRNAGANVVITRTGDYFVSLNERIRISEAYNTHAFVSLHYNAFPIISVNGVSTYYANETSRRLAQEVQSSLASTVSLHNRGVMQANYRVIHRNSSPAILMELGFITNPGDLAVIQTSDYQNKVAQAITNGLKSYFN